MTTKAARVLRSPKSKATRELKVSFNKDSITYEFIGKWTGQDAQRVASSVHLEYQKHQQVALRKVRLEEAKPATTVTGDENA